MMHKSSLTSSFDHAEFLSLLKDAHINSGRSLREIGNLCAIDHSYVARVLDGSRRARRDVLLTLCLVGWGLDPYDTDAILRTGGYKTIMDWHKAGWN